MGLIGHYELTEEERKELLTLRSRQEAMEAYIIGGNARGEPALIHRYECLLTDINEYKRRIIEESGNLDSEMFNYTFYFDTVAGIVWFEDAED